MLQLKDGVCHNQDPVQSNKLMFLKKHVLKFLKKAFLHFPLLGYGSLCLPWPVSPVYLYPPKHSLKDWAHLLPQIQTHSFHLLPGTSPFFKTPLSLSHRSVWPPIPLHFPGLCTSVFTYHVFVSPHLPLIQRTAGSSTPVSWELQPMWSQGLCFQVYCKDRNSVLCGISSLSPPNAAFQILETGICKHARVVSPSKETVSRDLLGGSVDKNLPANAGDMGLIPGPGGFHMPWNTPQPLSLCSRTRELQLQSPCAAATEARAPRTHAPQQKKPLRWEAWALQLESSPCSPQLEKAHKQQWKPGQPKIK